MTNATNQAAPWSVESTIDWLLEEGRFLTDLGALTHALGERLLATGAPVSRMRISVRILHPLITALWAVWEPGGAPTEPMRVPHGLEQRASYIGSPLEYVARTGGPFRRRLADGLGPVDHAVLHEIAATGATDYLALLMRFSGGTYGTIAFATDRAQGFEDHDIAEYERVTRILVPIVEARVWRRLAETLADTYIGPRSGRRVLEGRIRRGDVETLRAAIWFSDIRGWSRIANERPADEAIAIANDYFDLTDAAIVNHGGEILKLIGDAVLAIFPADTGDAKDEGALCRAAIAAASAARALAHERKAGFEFGIGLHLGELVYGNVGSESRLDFTVMGHAVNYAARIEKLTRALGEPVVLSQALADTSGLSCRDLGAHPIAGWDGPVRLFAPPV
ncbi:MAG: adenylate/guanylate cyclase domain-containing protein [Rhodospirillaceae bacterium]|nr:adenylate/guanylate cyclase domain-containing protein [Rhodospirillaceae bacterium]